MKLKITKDQWIAIFMFCFLFFVFMIIINKTGLICMPQPVFVSIPESQRCSAIEHTWVNSIKDSFISSTVVFVVCIFFWIYQNNKKENA